MEIPYEEVWGHTIWVNPEHFGIGLPQPSRALYSIFCRNMCWQGKWRSR